MEKIKNFSDAIIELANAIRSNKTLDNSDFDLNASAYSEVTNHNGKGFNFKGIFLKFSTTQVKTATLYLKKGTVETILWQSPTDTAAQNVVFIPDKDWRLPDGCELKLAITQAGDVCLADILVLTNPT